MLKRVKYVSNFAKPLSAGELERLGEAAAEKNRGLDVTGMLMTSGGLFYQVLEGPAAAVDELYATIVGDPRHTDVLKLSEEMAETRLFPDWSMRMVDLDAASHVRLLPLTALIKAVYEQRRLQDDMLWAIERTVQYEMGSEG